jgi:3-hydroxy acid dehydrogenase / malonic semialdehyde reductase
MSDMKEIFKNTLASISEQTSLKNKCALITGASSGIGLATSIALASEGVRTILVARRQEKLSQIESLFHNYQFAKPILVCADITKNEDVLKIKNTLNNIKLDIFINNAGLALGLDSVANACENSWETMISTNITAAFKLTKIAVKNMMQQNSGHLVHIGSIAGRTPYENGSVYTATKHALRAFSESLRQELCSTYIKNTLIAPGMVDTEFSEVRFGGNTERAKSVYSGFQPLLAPDIARAVLVALKQPLNTSFDDLLITPQAQGGMLKVHRI